MATIQQHIDEHIKGLRESLAFTANPDERATILRLIAEYEREKETGALHSECIPFVGGDERED